MQFSKNIFNFRYKSENFLKDLVFQNWTEYKYNLSNLRVSIIVYITS